MALIGSHSYAATWIDVKKLVRQELSKDQELIHYDPPQQRIGIRRVIVRHDGTLFADPDACLPEARPLNQVGFNVSLTTMPLPSRLLSGAGLKAYLAGKRPSPADVFNRVLEVFDRFMDFARSFGSQRELCELSACYVLATYLLGAFNVIGYLWPNGEGGSGKTNYLIVVTELAYLGELILAGGSYASLRDLADYGATLAFDDAENVMDVRRVDPDKRTLLLAGNRRGATVTFKELSAEKVWVTRYIDTFCPRLFSAIRLPDPVLSSRSIVLPLVRSGDKGRATANPKDHTTWPCDRRQLVDDLWAVGLANLHELRRFDARAAAMVSLTGRDLEPWRALLAVALWLQERHEVNGLFDRIERLMHAYQSERDDFEATVPTRLLLRALQELGKRRGSEEFTFAPNEVSDLMNEQARIEGLVEEDAKFTSPKKVGWLLKQKRFQKADRTRSSKLWRATRQEIENLANAYRTAEVKEF